MPVISKLFAMDKSEYISKCEMLYGRGDYSERYDDYYRSRRKLMRIIAAGCLLAIAAAVISGTGAESHLDETDDYYVVPRNGGSVSIPLNIKASNGRETIAKDMVLTVSEEQDEPEDTEAGDQQELTDEVLLDMAIDNALRKAANSPASDELLLPKTVGDDISLQWTAADDRSGLLVLILIPLLLIYVYQSRGTSIDKDVKAAREDISRSLPGFISNFALLLNAGVVQASAFDKIIKEHGDFRESDGHFFTRMNELLSDCRRTNKNFEQELCLFARSSGVREFIRIAGIIEDNVSKGTELASKMEKESNELWFARKKSAEERGRLAETKLTMPLVILLMVLIIVTISPAMLDM